MPMRRLWAEGIKMSYLWRVPHSLNGSAQKRTLGPVPSTAIDLALRESLIALGFGSAAPVAQIGTAR
jgi:hypothetical protein